MTEGSGVFQEADMENVRGKNAEELPSPFGKGPMGGTSRQRQRRNKLYREAIMQQANQGNVKAMEKVGRLYSRGMKGFEQDDEKAFSWYATAQKAGSVPAMAKMGELLVLGQGVQKDDAKGVMYLSLAAGRGSNFAAFLMGEYLADGTHGLDVDLAEARRMLEASLSENCPYNHMHIDMKEEAKEELKQVLTRIRFVDYMATA